MNNRFPETSQILISSLKQKYEAIEKFIEQNNNNANLPDIYTAYSACMSLRYFIDVIKKNQMNQLVDSEMLNTAIVSTENLSSEMNQNRILQKIEACEKMFQSYYLAQMPSIKAIFELNTTEHFKFIESINKDILVMNQNNFVSQHEVAQSAQIEEAKKLYVLIAFKYEGGCKIGAEAHTGAFAVMVKKPQILESLPDGATPGKFSKKAKATLFNDGVAIGYIHDCGNLSKTEVEKALQLFSHHYNDFKNDQQPTAMLNSIKPRDNEIIANLVTAINNMSLEPSNQKPLLKESSLDSVDEFIGMACY